jgi:hypothetical protein
MGFAIKNSYSEDGFRFFDAFSQLCPSKYNAVDVRSFWDNIDTNRENKLTEFSIRMWAKKENSEVYNQIMDELNNVCLIPESVCREIEQYPRVLPHAQPVSDVCEVIITPETFGQPLESASEQSETEHESTNEPEDNAALRNLKSDPNYDPINDSSLTFQKKVSEWEKTHFKVINEALFCEQLPNGELIAFNEQKLKSAFKHIKCMVPIYNKNGVVVETTSVCFIKKWIEYDKIRKY